MNSEGAADDALALLGCRRERRIVRSGLRLRSEYRVAFSALIGVLGYGREITIVKVVGAVTVPGS